MAHWGLPHFVIALAGNSNRRWRFLPIMGGLRARIIVWIGIAIPLMLIVLLVVVWQWDWLIPLVTSRASAAIGRPVSISHFHVRLGRTLQIAADDMVIANPRDWLETDPPLASIGKLTVQVDIWSYIRGRGLILPLIALDKPKVYAAETLDGKANFDLSLRRHLSSTKIGIVRVTDGDTHVVIPRLKLDVRATIVTQDEGNGAKLVIAGSGTYATQPIAVHAGGGALWSLHDAATPWPVDLTATLGPTHLATKGTLQNPLALEGANVSVHVSGPDMSLIGPLLNLPIPKTPPYEVAGKLDFHRLQKIRVDDFRGRVGDSDFAGLIEVDPRGTVDGNSTSLVTLDLQSSLVKLVDLNGFIGGQHGGSPMANGTPEQRAKGTRSAPGPRVLSDAPLSMLRLNWADIHLRYHGAHIQGLNVPLDNVILVMDAVGGKITAHPVSFGVGKGLLSATADLTPLSRGNIRAKIDLRLEKLDIARLLAPARRSGGTGSISGLGTIDAVGNSVASLFANGTGGLKMAMVGGELSALLIDLSGLQFGNALFSALGMPQKTPVRCFVSTLDLRQGILDFNTVVLDTGEAITEVDGNIDLRSERIDLNLKTDAKHFSVGSLPTRLTVAGTLKDATIRPGAQAAARAGAVVGLGALFPPLAILPTIQFGTSEQEDARCSELLRQARASTGGRTLPPPPQQAAGPER